MDSTTTTVRQLSDSTWAFEQGMVRCFYIAGADRALLLDTGVAQDNLFQRMMPLADLPLKVVNTHGDGDHTANNALFPSICAHPDEIPVLTARGPVPYAIEPVEEGHIFDLGGLRLEVLHTPGHTSGSICLLDRAHKTLYSGDTVSFGPVFLFGPGRDLDAYAQSLRRLKAMAAAGDFDTVYCCHNTCPVDVGVIDELLAALAGALDGSIPGEDSGRSFRTDAPVLTYRSGRSGVYLSL